MNALEIILPSAKTVRAAVKTYLAESAVYDASTLQITADGYVTAKLDADKVPGSNGLRLLVGDLRAVYARAAGLVC